MIWYHQVSRSGIVVREAKILLQNGIHKEMSKYPLVNIQKTIENTIFLWVNQLSMAMFNHVSLPGRVDSGWSPKFGFIHGFKPSWTMVRTPINPMCVPQALGYNCHSNNEEQQGMPRAKLWMVRSATPQLAALEDPRPSRTLEVPTKMLLALFGIVRKRGMNSTN